MHARLLPALSLVALLTFAQPAAAGGGDHSPCRKFARGPEISMQDVCFEGTAHVVKAGTTVEVTNDGGLDHDVVAVDGSFASKAVRPGETFEVTVDDAGVVPFYCTLHGTPHGDGMAGVLIVSRRL
ncbi:MAG: cupredoxin domain-containing protein [Acidimicrobiia bacterium]